MGLYIDPKNGTKEDWLREHGVPVSASNVRWPAPEGMLPVCLVHNPHWTAAGIAYDERQFKLFTYPGEERPRAYFYAPIEKLLEVEPKLKELMKL